MNRWFSLNGTLVKNPTDNEIKACERHQVIEYIPGIEGLVKEQWWVSIEDNKVIDFTYDCTMPSWMVSVLRKAHFTKHNVSPSYDRAYYLPPSYFSEDTVRLPH